MPARPIALSSWWRSSSWTPADLGARLLGLGVPAVLDATLPPAYLGELCRVLGKHPVSAVEAPCPNPFPRPPQLATDDRDERRAAVTATVATLELAAERGAQVVVVRLGALPLAEGWRRTTRAFAQRRLDASDISELLALRMRLSPRAIDLGRFGLEPVLDAAARHGITIAVPNRARWFEIPDDMELAVLLEELRGAPLAPWHDAAAAHAREALGFGRQAETLAIHGARSAGAWFSDASGLRGGLPWGRGEVDRALVSEKLAAEALRVVHAAPGVTDEEIREALGLAEA